MNVFTARFLVILSLVTIYIDPSSQAAGNYNPAEAENVLLYQRNNGGWPKNYDTKQELNDDTKKRLLEEKDKTDTGFDNGATHKEIRILAKAFKATNDKRYSDAALKGIEFTLSAQYENGGWPQFYPDASGYKTHITFNDNAMIGVMNLLSDITAGKPEFQFVDEKTKTATEKAVEKGLKCILDCQIKVNGKKTAWCAQHDEKTLAPAKARSYELVSISGSESVGIVRFLMGINKPSPEIIDAIQGAVTWFNDAQLNGMKLVQKKDKNTEKGYDLVVEQDSNAPPLWARFYEIGTNKPIFCSRDGIPRSTLAEISYERRNGYSWLGPYADKLLTKEYPAWKERVGM